MYLGRKAGNLSQGSAKVIFENSGGATDRYSVVPPAFLSKFYANGSPSQAGGRGIISPLLRFG
jgi:hypothetical protein